MGDNPSRETPLPPLNEAHISGNWEAAITDLQGITTQDQKSKGPHEVSTPDQESKETPSRGPDSRGKPGSLIDDAHNGENHKSTLETFWHFLVRLGLLLAVTLGVFSKKPTNVTPDSGRKQPEDTPDTVKDLKEETPLYHLVPQADLSKEPLDMGLALKENPSEGTPEGHVQNSVVLSDQALKNLIDAPLKLGQFRDPIAFWS